MLVKQTKGFFQIWACAVCDKMDLDFQDRLIHQQNGGSTVGPCQSVSFLDMIVFASQCANLCLIRIISAYQVHESVQVGVSNQRPSRRQVKIGLKFTLENSRLVLVQFSFLNQFDSVILLFTIIC